MFSLISMIVSYRRQLAAEQRVAPMAAPAVRRVANDAAVQGLARAA